MNGICSQMPVKRTRISSKEPENTERDFENFLFFPCLPCDFFRGFRVLSYINPIFFPTLPNTSSTLSICASVWLAM
jgi:hypothetical protein